MAPEVSFGMGHIVHHIRVWQILPLVVSFSYGKSRGGVVSRDLRNPGAQAGRQGQLHRRAAQIRQARAVILISSR